MKNTERVIVTDVQMTFLSMVVFILKWSLASIPAIVILMMLWRVVLGVFGGLFGIAGF